MNPVEKFLSEQPAMLQNALDQMQEENDPRGMSANEMLDCLQKILVGNLLSWLGLVRQIHEGIKAEDEELAHSLAQDFGSMVTLAITRMLPLELPKEVMDAHRMQILEAAMREKPDVH